MEKIQEKYAGKINFTVVTGGMITGDKVRTISQISDYILAGYKDMELKSNVKFGDNYINLVKEGSTVLHSDKPCKAVVAFRIMDPSKSLNFSHDLQRKLFLYGSSLNEDSTYHNISKEYGIDGIQFLKKMKSDSVKLDLLNDYKKVEEGGITGFPTLIMRINGQVILINTGFEKFEKLEKKIDKILKQHKG